MSVWDGNKNGNIGNIVVTIIAYELMKNVMLLRLVIGCLRTMFPKKSQNPKGLVFFQNVPTLEKNFRKWTNIFVHFSKVEIFVKRLCQKNTLWPKCSEIHFCKFPSVTITFFRWTRKFVPKWKHFWDFWKQKIPRNYKGNLLTLVIMCCDSLSTVVLAW